MITKVKKTEKKVENKKSGLTVDIFDLKGKITGKMDLPVEIFGQKSNPKLLAQVIRVALANKRQGTVSTKDRGEVSGSTRKLFSQKGRGRSRHGSIKAPIFVGGGIVFGPKPRDYSLKIPQKMKAKALFQALSDKLSEKRLFILELSKNFNAKTKEVAQFLVNIEVKTPVLLLSTKDQQNLVKSARNIKNLTLSPPGLLNSYHILTHKTLISTKEALEEGIALWLKDKK